jgi:AcrR family transcriptional regulator
MDQTTQTRGRPRDQTVERKIMQTALRLVKKHGVRSVTLERIAETSGIARTTIYRRWRNRSAILADAFLMQVQPEIGFPENASALERLRQQMHLLAASFRGNGGQMLRALLSEALTDTELQVAIRDGWIAPRRAAATVIIEKAVAAKELPQITSPDLLLDALYGGLYYWLLFDPARLTAIYIDSLFELVLHDASSHARGRAKLLKGVATTNVKIVR